MASARQIAANRSNARRSTGPTSAAGKAVSRLNALKHGLCMRGGITPEEERSDYLELVQEFLGHLQPVGPLETALAEEIADYYWWRGRASRIEANLLAGEWERVGQFPGHENVKCKSEALMRLARYSRVRHSQYAHALKELGRMQAARRAAEAEQQPNEANADAVTDAQAAGVAAETGEERAGEVFAEAPDANLPNEANLSGVDAVYPASPPADDAHGGAMRQA